MAGRRDEAVARGASAVVAISKSPVMAVVSGLAGTPEDVCGTALTGSERVGSALRLSVGDALQSLRRLERIDCVRHAGDGRWETGEAVVVRP
jgi:hypothetical protein